LSLGPLPGHADRAAIPAVFTLSVYGFVCAMTRENPHAMAIHIARAARKPFFTHLPYQQ
jgi:hypothetical protein